MITPDSASSKADLLTTWFQRVWTEEDASAIDDMLAADAVIRGVGNAETVGPEPFRIFQQSVLRYIGGIKVTIHRLIEDGDWMAAVWSMTATSRTTGEPVRTSGTVFVEVRDGKFVGGYNHFDNFGLYTDMGLLPQDTIPRLFAGSAFA